jgi:hypothetical protein
LLRVSTRQAAIERITVEESGARLALRFAAGAEGEPELAWKLFIRLGFALESGSARTADVLAAYALVQPLPPRRCAAAALAVGVWCYARSSLADLAADTDLAAACAVIEAAGERDFLPTLLTAWGTLLAPATCARPGDPRARLAGCARGGPDRHRGLGAHGNRLRASLRRRYGRDAALRRRAGQLRAAPP